jgi:hypothetical protein
VVAFGAHIVVNDVELSRSSAAAYHRVGRWVLASAGLLGWVVAAVWRPSPVVVAAMVGLLSGSTIVDVVRSQVRTAQERRLGLFIAGALAYAAIALAFEYSLTR